MENLGSYLSRGAYTVAGPFHPFGGAVDIIVVEQPDGSFKSSPWYVRFGKFEGVLKRRRGVINISVNGVESDLQMHLDNNGEAYFLKEVDAEEGDAPLYQSLSCTMTNGQPEKYMHPVQSMDYISAGAKSGTGGQRVDVTDKKIVNGCTSRSSGILGLMFGERSMKERHVTYETVGSAVKRFNSLESAEIAADLLEVKWSTNLGSGDAFKKDVASRFPRVGGVTTKDSKNMQAEEVEVIEDRVVSREFYSTHADKLIDGSETSEPSVEDARFEFSISRSLEKVVERHTSGDDSGTSQLEYLATKNVDMFSDDFQLAKKESESRGGAEPGYGNDWVPQSQNPDMVTDDFLLPVAPLVGSQSSIELSVPSSDISDEEQFDFSDGESQLAKPELLDKKKFREDRNKLSLPLDKCVECSNQGIQEKLLGESKFLSSPVSIQSDFQASRDLEGRLSESLPELQSPHKLMNSEDPQPLSFSLDSESSPVWWSVGNDKAGAGKSQLEKEQNLGWVGGQLENLDSPNLTDLQFVLSNHEVELSLCKHLLHEGMGSEAALKAFNSKRLDIDTFTSLGPAVVMDDMLIVKINGNYYPWAAAAPIILGIVSFGNSKLFEPKGMIPVDKIVKTSDSISAQTMVTSGGRWRLWPFSIRQSSSRKTLPKIPSNTKTSDDSSDGYPIKPNFSKRLLKGRTPTSEQLASLSLKEGMNLVTFTSTNGMLGGQKVDAKIYLWKWITRIVISDVDGTITRSDVLGQFMPLMGMDWSQSGVAHLFSAIKENGYQLLFLSARAISQASLTRHFLFNLKQDGKALPEGPVVISPDGLFPSLFREVIKRVPHEFKIACLEDIRALFPPEYNPFYAGFGNRHTDEISYLKVGIPQGKIFTINPRGEIVVNRRVDTRSYSTLHALVHGMFPPTNTSEQEDFNCWNYWKLPPPTIDL